MTRNPRSEKSSKNHLRIQEGRQEQEEEEEEAPGSSEIGSRVFPFRSPASASASASMPTVGTRRSTRVFLPRLQRATGDGGSERIIRSDKSFDPSTAKEVDRSERPKAVEDEKKGRIEEKKRFGTVYGRKRWESTLENRSEWLKVVEDEKKGRIDEKKRFGAVYGRKRCGPTMENQVKDGRFGIVYQRKHRRKLTGKALVLESESREFRVLQCSKNFGERLGLIAEGDLWSGLECGGSAVLAVLVNSSVSFSSDRFGHFLVSVLEWMRRTRVELLDLVVFLFGRSIGRVFSLNGIHFLPIRHRNNGILNRNSVPGCGLCKIYGARELVPLLSVDYSTLPFYFKFLHSVMILGSQYLPSILLSKSSVRVLENQLAIVPCGKHVDGDDDHVETALPGAEFVVSESPAVKWDDMPTVDDSCVLISHNPGPPGIISSSRLRKHQRKRSSLKNLRAPNPSIRNRHFRSVGSIQSSSASSTRCDFADPLVTVKPHDPYLSNLVCGREDIDFAPTPVSCLKLKNIAEEESPVENIKEMRSALAEVRQNIDSTCCNANILVTDTGKCWREDGAQVRLELSDSQEWFIAVKRGDNTRFLYKPQDLRPCVVNRFSNTYIWSGNDDWKLEFVDKWDWYIFKELHMECHNRNTPVASMNAIPVPGAREVPGYEDDADTSFVRPDTYINVTDDEVGRALASEISYYDMDLADEEWLRDLNSNSSGSQDGCTSYVSEDNFEKIIFALEKDAYCHLNDTSDKERLLDLCQGLGTRNMVSAIFDYWLKKRKLKRTPLVRVFQDPPLRKTQLMRKQFLRKKRSFKRQKSQAERNQVQRKLGKRGKPAVFFQDHQEMARRVTEAEAAASIATEVATKIRTRAQKLMSNADLESYKAAMALRIAETIRVSSSTEPSDLESSILFD